VTVAAKLGVRAAVTALLLGGLAWFVPWQQLAAQAQKLDPGVWCAVLGVMLLGHLLGVFKWRLAMNPRVVRLGPLQAIRCYAAGLFANMFLPSIVGGDALRAVLAGRMTRRYEAVVFGGIADRLSDVLALVMLAAVGGLCLRQHLPGWAVGLLWTAAIAAVSGLAVVVLVLRRMLRWSPRLRRPVLHALVAGRRLLRQPGRAAVVLACSLSIQGTFALLNMWIGTSIGIEVTWAAWMFAFPVAKLASLLPISIAGFGVREASLTGVLLVVEVPPEQGVLVPLVWGSMLIASSSCGGLVWLFTGMGKNAAPDSLLAAARVAPGFRSGD